MPIVGTSSGEQRGYSTGNDGQRGGRGHTDDHITAQLDLDTITTFTMGDNSENNHIPVRKWVLT